MSAVTTFDNPYHTSWHSDFFNLSNHRWWSKETVAVVTGGNRGIGFETSRQLAGHGLTVILTSRNANAGYESAKILQEGGLDVVSQQLDVLDSSSIYQFVEWLKENYGGLDILVSFVSLISFKRSGFNSITDCYWDLYICLYILIISTLSSQCLLPSIMFIKEPGIRFVYL